MLVSGDHLRAFAPKGLGGSGVGGRPYRTLLRSRSIRRPRYDATIRAGYKSVHGKGIGKQSPQNASKTGTKTGTQRLDLSKTGSTGTIDGYDFNLPPLPNLEDIKSDRVIRGSLLGSLAGTVLSVFVSPLQATSAAAAVAAATSLTSNFDTKNIGSAVDGKGAELPGEATAALVATGQDLLETGEANNEGSGVTAAAASLIAGSTVSVFAAKSLPLIFGASAIYVAAEADDSIDLKGSTIRARDFLRSRQEAGVGIAFSLLVLQAKHAVTALTSLVDEVNLQGSLRLTADKVEDQSLEGILEEAKARPVGSEKKAKPAELEPPPKSDPSMRLKIGNGLLKPKDGVLVYEAKPKTDPGSSPVQKTSGTPKVQLEGGPDESENPLTTSTPLQSTGVNVDPQPLTVLNSKSDSPKSKSSGAKESADQATPLEKLKGGGKTDKSLSTGPVEKKSAEPLLKPDSGATSTSGSKTPLENVKGGNKDVGAGDMIQSKPTDFSQSKEGVLTGDSAATQQAGARTPLENVKGGNAKIGAEDLIEQTPTDFVKEKGILTGSSPATKTKDSRTPLENVKGGNEKIGKEDLIQSAPTDFSKNKDGLLSGDSSATKTKGAETPLENVKGGNKDVSKDSLIQSPPSDFSKNKDGLLSGDSPATKTEGSKTPLENVKGGKSDVSAKDLASSPGKLAAQPSKSSILQPGSSATTSTGPGTPLQNLKGKDVNDPKRDISMAPLRYPAKQPSSGTAYASSGFEPSFNDEDDKRHSRSLQLRGAQNPSKALQLNAYKPGPKPVQSSVSATSTSAPSSRPSSSLTSSAASVGNGKQALLDSMAQKKGGSSPGSAPHSATTVASSKPSGSSGSIIDKPYEAGKTALEQDLAPTASTASSPARRSAARPSEISKLAAPAAGKAPSALTRPSSSGGEVTGLEKPESSAPGSALAFAPRANVQATPRDQTLTPPKKKSFTERLLVAAGGGLFGSLLGVVLALVQGQTMAHPVPRALLTAVFFCVAAIVILISTKKDDSSAAMA